MRAQYALIRDTKWVTLRANTGLRGYRCQNTVIVHFVGLCQCSLSSSPGASQLTWESPRDVFARWITKDLSAAVPLVGDGPVLLAPHGHGCLNVMVRVRESARDSGAVGRPADGFDGIVASGQTEDADDEVPERSHDTGRNRCGLCSDSPKMASRLHVDFDTLPATHQPGQARRR